MTQARKSDSTGRLPEDTNELVESKKVVIMRPTKLLIIVTAALLCVAASDPPCRGEGRAVDSMTAEETMPCGCAHARTDGERLVNTPSSTLGSTGGPNRGELMNPID